MNCRWLFTLAIITDYDALMEGRGTLYGVRPLPPWSRRSVKSNVALRLHQRMSRKLQVLESKCKYGGSC